MWLDCVDNLTHAGTSLSKAYGTIERFWEDVDVLLAPAEVLSEARRDKLLKAVTTRAAADLGLGPRLSSSTRGVKRDVVYEYPAAYPNQTRPTAGVRLEMGIRGGPEPMSAATLLHDRASRLAFEPAALAGLGRHVYDVYCLLRDGGVRQAISVPGVVAALVADAEALSRRHGFRSTPRPEAGSAASPAWPIPEMCAGPCRRVRRASWRGAHFQPSRSALRMWRLWAPTSRTSRWGSCALEHGSGRGERVVRS